MNEYQAVHGHVSDMIEEIILFLAMEEEIRVKEEPSTLFIFNRVVIFTYEDKYSEVMDAIVALAKAHVNLVLSGRG